MCCGSVFFLLVHLWHLTYITLAPLPVPISLDAPFASRCTLRTRFIQPRQLYCDTPRIAISLLVSSRA
ncbi:hypothetical protein SeMB42_g03263 [Synchytrium endobioticum]|uniref:Secreted protein n=1 Tax=Synchytrium endobioticum TaxID=286115 RepID=A0A507D807_9FUNG|nr:hypothetical protein SeMB42_g03263 [Synchytrium endobioticum]